MLQPALLLKLILATADCAANEALSLLSATSGLTGRGSKCFSTALRAAPVRKLLKNTYAPNGSAMLDELGFVSKAADPHRHLIEDSIRGAMRTLRTIAYRAANGDVDNDGKPLCGSSALPPSSNAVLSCDLCSQPDRYDIEDVHESDFLRLGVDGARGQLGSVLSSPLCGDGARAFVADSSSISSSSVGCADLSAADDEPCTVSPSTSLFADFAGAFEQKALLEIHRALAHLGDVHVVPATPLDSSAPLVTPCSSSPSSPTLAPAPVEQVPVRTHPECAPEA